MTKTKRVLLLDDDPLFRALVRPILEGKGFAVSEAGSGKLADELMAQGSFDLIMVDGLLPDVDGINWIGKHRASGCSSKIIYASAYWRDAAFYQQLTNQLQVALVLHKPI